MKNNIENNVKQFFKNNWLVFSTTFIFSTLVVLVVILAITVSSMSYDNDDLQEAVTFYEEQLPELESQHGELLDEIHVKDRKITDLTDKIERLEWTLSLLPY